MTPQEKAKELFSIYYKLGMSANNHLNIYRAKIYSIIAIDLTIEYNDFHIEFLQEVKDEIEKL